jgi:hypothetical protein
VAILASLCLSQKKHINAIGFIVFIDSVCGNVHVACAGAYKAIKKRETRGCICCIHSTVFAASYMWHSPYKALKLPSIQNSVEALMGDREIER